MSLTSLQNGLLVLGLLEIATGCAGAVESSKFEDRARRTVPVPICLKPLERHGAEGVVSSLKPEDYWSLVLPSFDAGASTVDRSSPDCAGRPVFDNPELAQAEGVRTGPLVVKLDDAVITPAADSLRIAWFRTHHFSDGTAAGPLALVRPREGYAEVYATGFYRGRTAESHFSVERMGSRVLISASDEGCTGVKPNQSCQTLFSVFLMNAGYLNAAARFPLDRVEYRSAPGVSGTAQYRLTATPVFQERAIRVQEQVIVRDSSQGVVRKSDLERIYTLAGGQLAPSADSLWAQVAGDGSSPSMPSSIPSTTTTPGAARTPPSVPSAPRTPSVPSVPHSPSVPSAPRAPSAPRLPSPPSPPQAPIPRAPSVPSPPSPPSGSLPKW
ncbi:MAG TPA: hypothetical protein VFQ35_01370 [Polyangiaceae bacterium]|nr:hypothetical protein [Polyangiaceae bacterium]